MHTPPPHVSAFQIIREQLTAALAAPKCYSCGCFQQTVAALTSGGQEDLAPLLDEARTVFQPKQYDCLGCPVCYPAIAANAFTTTTLATAVASFVWPMAEWIFRGKPSVLGFCSGAVAGLVVITPACGFVTPKGAMAIGVVAGLIPWFFCYKVKGWFGYDDALDTFGVHAIGGTLGAFMTGMLARTAANGNLKTFLVPQKIVTDSRFQPLVFEQIKAILLTLVLATVGTAIIAFLVKAVIGLRPSEEVEQAGLDLNEHGEEGYHGAGQL